MDVDAIQPGRDFRKAIEESLQKCAVLLTVIGPEWLDARGQQDLRRLDDPGDYVRLEIAAALRRDIPVIPVLVRGAKMPQPDQLPPDLADLAFRNSVELTHARWKSDMQVLMHALEPYMPHVPGSTKHEPHPAPALPPASLEKVTALLAFHIGPIASVVVKRAAKTAESVPALCAAVAQEIESPAARKQFLAHFHDDHAARP